MLEAEVELAGVENVDDLSPEAMELLKFLAASREQLQDDLAEGFSDINAVLAKLTVSLHLFILYKVLK